MPEETCCVCGQPLDGENMMNCTLCSRPFHLAMSLKSEAPNCGRYMLAEGSWGLAFVCNVCAVRGRPPQPDEG